jgi:hypothetical protein
MARIVRTCPDGTPSMTSSLFIVAVPTPELSDNRAELQRNKALPARICSLVINSKSIYNDPNWII